MLSQHDNNEAKKMTKEQAAMVLQAYVRRYHVRENICQQFIPSLPDAVLLKYKAFAVGNDPLIPDAALNPFVLKDESLALLATSGMRAIKIACKLGATHKPPRIFLMDNSLYVHQFWDFLKKAARESQDEYAFYDMLDQLDEAPGYHRQLKVENLHRNSCVEVAYPEQSMSDFISWSIIQRGYDYVREVILNTVLLRQSWLCQDFSQLKSILDFMGFDKIAVYASNIAAIQYPEDTHKLLNSLEVLNPYLSIHSDVCEKHQRPHRTLLFTDPKSDLVKLSIFAMPYAKNLAKVHDVVYDPGFKR